jgi:hypothetical protein
MRTPPPKKEPSQKATPRQRKPPRLTSSIFKYADRFGFNIRIKLNPDGTSVTDLIRPGSTDPVEETPEALRKLL